MKEGGLRTQLRCWGASSPPRTFEEVLHLLPHLAGQPVLGQQVEVVHFVLVVHGDLGPARDQLHHLVEDMAVVRRERAAALFYRFTV